MSRVILAGLWFAILAAAQPGSDSQVLQRAVNPHQSGNHPAAIEAYTEFLKVPPDAAPVRSNLGAALAHEGRFVDAIREFADAIREYRLALDADRGNAKVRLNLALAYFKTPQLREAAGELAIVLQTEPTNQQATLLLAACYLRRGENKKVIALVHPIWRQEDGNLAIAYLLGVAFIRDDQVERGQVLFDRILKNGESAEAHLLMGTRPVVIVEQTLSALVYRDFVTIELL